MDKKEFEITATVTIEVKFDVESESELDALSEGRKHISDVLYLNSSGGIVNDSKIEFLEASEIEYLTD